MVAMTLAPLLECIQYKVY